MTCKECNQRNPIGNKFCRECGAKIVIPEGSLAAEEAARADSERKSERAAILLSDAHLLAEQGKYLAAIPVAEEAVATLPFSVSALTLLVNLYEQTDQQEKAIAAQERIVSVIPNAENEATRLERLKRGERTIPPAGAVSADWVPTLRGVAPSTVPFALPQWFPVAAGVIGGGFALYLGFLAMSPGKPTSARVSVAPTPLAAISPQPPAEELLVNPGAMPPPPSDPNRTDPFVSLDETRRKLQQQQTPVPPARPLPPSNITAGASLPLPKPLPGARNTAAKPAPVVIPADIIKVTRGNGAQEEAPLPPISAAPPTNPRPEDGFGSGERVSAAPPSPESAPPKPSGGYMKITVNQRPGPAPIPVAPPKENSSPDMESDPMQRARVLQGMKRYQEAISAYQEAISTGAPAGEAQQSIALCYQRAGDLPSAKVAYIQAIAAYKAQIAAGRNPSAAQRGLNTCEAALGVLNGG